MAEAKASAPVIGSAQERAGGLRMFRAMAHRDYRYLLGGNLATQTGQWVQQIGRGWLVYQLTHSEFQLGLVAFFQGLAMLTFAPLGGFLADRFDRRRVMVISQFFLMLIAVVTAVLVLTRVIAIWHLYATGFVSGAFFSINNPTRQALVHDLVGKEDLPNAIGLNSVAINSTRVVGPSLGGLLLSAVGVDGTFFFQAAGYVVAMALTLVIRAQPKNEVVERTPFLESVRGGVRYAKNDRAIAILLFLGLITAVLGWPYLQLMPAYTTEVLHLGKTGYGLAMSAVGGGAVCGALFVAAADIRKGGRILVAAQMGTGTFLMLLGLSTLLPTSVLCLAALGVASAFTQSMNQTLIQLNVEDQYRGRVISLYFLGFGLQPAGTLPAGALGQAFGVRAAIFALGAAMFAIIAPVALLSKRVRAL